MSPTSFSRVPGAGALRVVLLATVLIVSLPLAAMAQSVSVNLGEGNGLSTEVIQLFLLITVLSMAPGIAMMITCFPFMVTVLSLLRQGIGLQAAPPNMMIISLALFLTYFVMEPVFSEAWATGLRPLMDGDITAEQGFERSLAPFRVFMEARVRPDIVAALADAAPQRTLDLTSAERTPLELLIPSFMLSEIERAFEIGFMIFLPFLIIDLVVASVLMSMGMMMVPPVVVSLPLKLAFFVVADGWSLLAGALIRGYAT
jgi:flagellar biosynthetic protein FliP